MLIETQVSEPRVMYEMYKHVLQHSDYSEDEARAKIEAFLRMMF